MLNKVFGSIFKNDAFLFGGSISPAAFIICIVVALVCGGLLALAYALKSKYTKSFLITLSLLPTVVTVVIMLVNGNIGAGVAVAGAFSLVRFRSVAGSAKEIIAIFIGTCIGLIAGMGFLTYAAIFTVLMCVIFVVLNASKVFTRKKETGDRTVRITIPEDLDYTEVFDDIFKNYTKSYESVSVRTTNMGSMFKLTYRVVLKDVKLEKQFIDELRCRNGNLEITVSRKEDTQVEL